MCVYIYRWITKEPNPSSHKSRYNNHRNRNTTQSILSNTSTTMSPNSYISIAATKENLWQHPPTWLCLELATLAIVGTRVTTSMPHALSLGMIGIMIKRGPLRCSLRRPSMWLTTVDVSSHGSDLTGGGSRAEVVMRTVRLEHQQNWGLPQAPPGA